MDLTALRRKSDLMMSDYRHVCQTVRDEKRNLRDAEGRLSVLLESQELIQTVAQGVQQQAHDRIASVVSKCLAAVFEEPYEFRIVFDRKRGKTEARIVFLRDGNELSPKDAAGGGCVDVAAFALRLVCMTLTKPPVRKVLILDEPFKMVSQNNVGRVQSLLLSLAEEYGVQFIIVTHDRGLACGNIIEIERGMETN